MRNGSHFSWWLSDGGVVGADIVERINTLKHLIAAIAWICFFVFSAYVLIEKMVNSKPYLIFHFIVPFSLLLVSIRATRRYLAVRKVVWNRAMGQD